VASPERSNPSNDRRSALLVATSAAFQVPFMVSSINIALPSIGREFHLDGVTLGWVATTYLLATAVMLVPFGRLSDIHGRIRVFRYGLALFVAAALASAAAGSGWFLIAARAVHGVSGAMILGTSVALITSAYPPGERGRALGWNVTAVYTGMSVGPFVGGLLTQALGWRSIFGLVALIGGSTLLHAVRRLRGDGAPGVREPFDAISALLYGFSLIAFIYGLSNLTKPFGPGLAAAGLTGLAVFAARQRRVKSPILNVELFLRNRVFALSGLAALIHYSSTASVGFLLSIYLQVTKGATPQAAGLVLLWQPAMQAIFSPFAGRLSDRIEPRYVASLGMTLTGLGIASFLLLDPGTPIVAVAAGLIVLGTGYGLFSSPNQNAAFSAVDPKFLGVVSGTLGTMRLTGNILSMAVAMLLFALHLRGAPITPERADLFLRAARTAFGISATMCAIGALLSLSRGDVRAQTGRPEAHVGAAPVPSSAGAHTRN
jgi:MFS family permease